MPRFRLVWLFALTALAAVIFSYLGHFVFDQKWPDSKFPNIDGTLAVAQYIDVGDGDQLFIRYGAISESGVELERVVNGKTRWRVFSPPLGDPNAKCQHDVHVGVIGDQVRISSRAAGNHFYEQRELKSGKLISRFQN